MRLHKAAGSVALLFGLFFATRLAAQIPPDWTKPFPPHRLHAQGAHPHQQ
ncbi:MAG: hypothetical protein ABSF53_09960 [Terracidiphilus sp.]